MRSIWKGAISFGLVTIPVKLYSATEQKDVSFHQVRRSDGSRIKYKRVAAVDGEEVSYGDIAKGYELGNGETVVLTDEDFKDLPLTTNRAIDVLQFVPLEELDPIFFEKSYYLEPDKAGIKPYVLLRDALEQSGKVAVVKVALRNRESLAALRVRDGVFVLETMLWPDEVRTPDFGFLDDDVEVRPQELAMAGSLIETLSGEFDASQYKDSYREALEAVIEAKVQGREVVQPTEEQPTSGTVVDLMAALRASVEAAKSGRPSAGGGAAAADEPAPAPRKRAAKRTARRRPSRPPRRRRPRPRRPRRGQPARRRPRRRPPRRARPPPRRRRPRRRPPSGSPPERTRPEAGPVGSVGRPPTEGPMTAPLDDPLSTRDLLGDPARVAAVRRVLGQGSAASGLDRLTRLAADLLEAPHCQVSLVAEEQVVASVFGLDRAAGQRTGPAADSLCTVTVRLGAPFSVSDALLDRAGARPAPVTSGAVRRYLGVPLGGGVGPRCSAPCASSTPSPRPGARTTSGCSAELGASAIVELELRAPVPRDDHQGRAARPRAVRGRHRQLRLGPDTGELKWDERLIRLFGYQRGEFGERIEDFNARLHEDDRERVGEALRRSIDTVGDLSMEYRILRPDGERWIEARGRALAGPDGTSVRLLGVAYDITELRQVRDRLARTLESMTDAFYSLDEQWCFTFVNPQAEKLLGRARDELLGRSIWTEFPPRSGRPSSGVPRRGRAGSPPPSRPTTRRPLDGWYELRAWPTPDGLSVYFREITARRRPSTSASRPSRSGRRRTPPRRPPTRGCRLLADASHLLAQSLEPRQVLQRLSRWCCPSSGSARAWRSTAEPPRAAAAELPATTPCTSCTSRTATRSAAGARGGAAALRPTTATRWASARSCAPASPSGCRRSRRAYARSRPTPTTVAAMRDLGVGAALTVPLISRGRVLGRRDGRPAVAGRVDRALLADLGARAAVALDNALLYRAERRTGLTLQRSLLPARCPQLPGIEVAVRYRPGRDRRLRRRATGTRASSSATSSCCAWAT
jgi:DNA end-binding protein Ku